jgi:hypothetical protein
MQRSRILVFLLLSTALLCGPSSPAAQPVGVGAPCRSARANPSGLVPRQDTAIDTTVVTVINKNEKLCGAIIQNTSPTQALRCASISDGAPTAVEGFRLGPGSPLMLGIEAQPGWQCIRDTTATSAGSVSVEELFP